MSTLKTGALRGTSGTADSVQLHASDQSVTFPGNVTVSGTMTGGGKVLDVKQTVYSGQTTESLAAGAFGAARCSISHAAASGSNKLLLEGILHLSLHSGNQRMGLGLYVGGSIYAAATGDASGSKTRLTACSWATDSAYGVVPVTFKYLLSSPSTSSTTYDIRAWHGDNATKTVYINYEKDSTDHNYHQVCISTLTLTEIAA